MLPVSKHRHTQTRLRLLVKSFQSLERLGALPALLPSLSHPQRSSLLSSLSHPWRPRKADPASVGHFNTMTRDDDNLTYQQTGYLCNSTAPNPQRVALEAL